MFPFSRSLIKLIADYCSSVPDALKLYRAFDLLHEEGETLVYATDDLLPRMETVFGGYVQECLARMFGFDAAFFSCLHGAGAVLSGSSVLQILIGTSFENFDGDIFMFDAEYERQCEENNRCRQSDCECVYCTDGVPRNLVHWIHLRAMEADTNRFGREHEFGYAEHMKRRLKRLFTYELNGKLLQLITIDNIATMENKVATDMDTSTDDGKPKALMAWIQNDFDMKWCMNTFDGRNVHIVSDYELLTMRGRYLGKSDNEEHMLCGMSAWGLQLHYRALKYIRRGFTFTNYRVPQRIWMLGGVDGKDDITISTRQRGFYWARAICEFVREGKFATVILVYAEDRPIHRWPDKQIRSIMTNANKLEPCLDIWSITSIFIQFSHTWPWCGDPVKVNSDSEHYQAFETAKTLSVDMLNQIESEKNKDVELPDVSAEHILDCDMDKRSLHSCWEYYWEDTDSRVYHGR